MEKTTDWVHMANNVIENCNYVIQRLKITRDCDACIREHEDLQKLAKQFLVLQKENEELKRKLVPTKPNCIYEDEPICPFCGEILDLTDDDPVCCKCGAVIDWIEW